MSDEQRKAFEGVIMERIPLRIDCPGCHKIFVLWIENFDQGVSCLLGQACPHCKRFINEKDNPLEIIVGAKEIRERNLEAAKAEKQRIARA
jgi:hypothetical protein